MGLDLHRKLQTEFPAFIASFTLLVANLRLRPFSAYTHIILTQRGNPDSVYNQAKCRTPCILL